MDTEIPEATAGSLDKDRRARVATRAALYAPPRSTLSAREALIHEGIEAALRTIAGIEVHAIGGPNVSPSPLPGLAQANASHPVIALGLSAHIALSHVGKRTLLVEDFVCGAPDDGALDEEIATLVWSSVNTARLVALGAPAWQAAQLLPVDERIFHQVPPLRMRPADDARAGILVVAHADGDARAAFVVEALTAAGLEARYTFGLETGMNDRSWSDDAAVHVHVGASGHEIGGPGLDLPRLVDSWHSGRVVVQLEPIVEERNGADHRVEPDVDGLLCGTADDVVEACRDVIEDPTLRRKLIAGGEIRVAPFVMAWRAIAEDLIA